MSILIHDLTLSITPNNKPEWNGNIKGAVFDPSTKLITYTAPISKVSGGYEYISLDLWVESWTCKNEDTFSLQGIPYSIRPLITHSDPSIICPCPQIMDEFIKDNQNTYGLGYKEIYQETLGNTLNDLIENTGWSILIDSTIIQNFPVVTEINPVVVLNGTILEQLRQLLGIFTPDNLWDQSLSFFLNIFTLEILIVPPEGSNSFFNINLDIVKPIDFNVRQEDISEKPLNIILQEYETALYRDISHFAYGKYNTESYKFVTSASIEEADLDQTDIRASISGNRINIGRLTLKDEHNVIIDESKYGSITATYGSNLVPKVVSKVSWSENKTTDITVITSYEYILGPPYGDMEDQGYVYKKGDIPNPINSCFPSSLPGTRQQISRDLAPLKITKDNYPEFLVNTDGIRVSKKIVTTTETVKLLGNTPEDGQNYPVGEEDQNQTTVTEVIESLAYDEKGNLVVNRNKKIVTQDNGAHTIVNTTLVISPISDDFYAQTTYSVTSEYDKTGSLKDSSVTDISIQTVSGDQTGPQPISAFASVEDNDLLREKELSSNSSSDTYANGTVYTGVNNLTLEEAENYLLTHYLLGPDSAFYVSFESEFIDPRNVIGGFVKLNGSLLNRSLIYEMDNNPKTMYSTRIVNNSSMYRITGIALNWESEQPPIVAIALCRME